MVAPCNHDALARGRAMTTPPLVQLQGDEPLDFVVREVLRVLGKSLGDFVESRMAAKGGAEYEAWQRLAANPKNNVSDPLFTLNTILGGTPGLEEVWEDIFEAEFGDNLGDDPKDLLYSTKRIRGDMAHYKEDFNPVEVVDAFVVIEKILAAIDAPDKASLVRKPRRQIEDEANHKAKRTRTVAPPAHPVNPGTRCVGLHWEEPVGATPSAWWVVSILDGHLEIARGHWSDDQLLQQLQVWHSTAPLLAGLAFCFSAPAWLIQERYSGTPRELWERCFEAGLEPDSDLPNLADALSVLGEPFFSPYLGQAEVVKAREDRYRNTEERVLRETGAEPGSVFEVGPPGSVGALAIRGMAFLSLLPRDDFAVWPFRSQERQGSTCVEIFPRSLWAALNPGGPARSTSRSRVEFLNKGDMHGLIKSSGTAETFTTERRAFDALVTAWALSRYGRSLPSRKDDMKASLEGEIWLPMEKPPGAR